MPLKDKKQTQETGSVVLYGEPSWVYLDTVLGFLAGSTDTAVESEKITEEKSGRRESHPE